MTRYYHVDRRKGLREGQILDVKPSPARLPGNLDEVSLALFPRETSTHGEAYLYGQNGELPRNVKWNDAAYEFIWEQVRRASYQDKPSRFQSYFGLESKQEARDFIESSWNPNASWGPEAIIWEVDAPEAFRADMAWLSPAAPLVEAINHASSYWRQDATKDPTWEVLLPAGTRVVERAETYSAT